MTARGRKRSPAADAASDVPPIPRGLRAALLRWYTANRRDLPWRRTRDPYAIWLSETMLQQTRVETVIPYWERFLAAFPTVADLAAAEPDAVYRHWAGLGYYSRARNLHAAARSVVADWGGEFPRTAEDLRRLPGIGPYTAGALASIAFDRPEPIVDGNVVRVLTRILGIREDVSRAGVMRQLWAAAAALADGERPGDLNQAMMELGATVCSPRAPSCLACPVRSRCSALAEGDAEQLPNKTRKTRVVPFSASVAWIERRGRVLAVRAPEGALLGGLWELPGGALEGGEGPADGLGRLLSERLNLRLAASPNAVGEVDHVFSHRRLRLHVFRGETAPGRVRRSYWDEHRWVATAHFGGLPRAAPTRKALELLAAGAAPASRNPPGPEGI